MVAAHYNVEPDHLRFVIELAGPFSSDQPRDQHQQEDRSRHSGPHDGGPWDHGGASVAKWFVTMLFGPIVIASAVAVLGKQKRTWNCSAWCLPRPRRIGMPRSRWSGQRFAKFAVDLTDASRQLGKASFECFRDVLVLSHA
jgi:hypothetical protein